ncbi:AAA family ATPase [Limosilactobacillus gorillae]|uniref:AAA family ATPase n=1 Tax=Limosilactobacillus gorillae TaxID=1450649 RepID=UPI000AF359E3|nr:AAA family ATPase [Limosilactobacillus gorillae]
MALIFQELKATLPALLKAGSVPNIVGEAGIGKSALVAEVAQQMGATLLTTVVSLAEKGDLALPVPPLTKESLVTTSRFGTLADVKYGYSTTLVTLLKEAEAHPNRPIIWFLDEFNRGNAAVQSELMNVVLQRRIHTLTLPDEVKIILAQNPDPTMEAAGDYAVTPSDAAVRDRTVRLEMRADLADWLAWATARTSGHPRVQPVITDYLSAHPQLLAPLPVAGQITPTPRSWERASRNLTELQKLPHQTLARVLADVLAGDLGEEVGVALAREILVPRVTVANLLDPATPVQEVVAHLSEGERVALFNQWLASVATEPLDLSSLPRALALLETLSEDGQVAVGEHVGRFENFLSALYQAVPADPGAQAFYTQLEEIAKRGANNG